MIARQQKKANRDPRTGRSKGLSVAFILDGQNRTAEVQGLQEQQAEIENKWGESLSWHDLLNSTRVEASNLEVDVTNEADWPNQHKWLATKIERLVEVFRPRILQLRGR